jgi:hypothetical protein
MHTISQIFSFYMFNTKKIFYTSYICFKKCDEVRVSKYKFGWGNKYNFQFFFLDRQNKTDQTWHTEQLISLFSVN